MRISFFVLLAFLSTSVTWGASGTVGYDQTTRFTVPTDIKLSAAQAKVGTGDNQNIASISTTGMVQIVRGTSSAPFRGTNSPMMKLSQTVSFTNAPVGDGSLQAANILSYIVGDVNNGIQVIGFYGRAENHGTNSTSGASDAAGGYFNGVSWDNTGVGIGVFAIGHRKTSFGKATAMQVAVSNDVTNAPTFNQTGFTSLSGIQLLATGVADSGAGIQMNTGGQQFMVGFANNGQISGGKTGAVSWATFYDGGTPTNGILLIGKYASAAIATAVGSGRTLLGGTNALKAASQLEVQDLTVSSDPFVEFGTPNVLQNNTLWVENSAGVLRAGVAGNANFTITGSAAGDAIITPKSTKSLILGSSLPVITILSNNIGFFGATPIARESSTTDLKNVLVDFGLLTDGGATPLNLDGGTIASGAITTSDNITLSPAGAGIFQGGRGIIQWPANGRMRIQDGSAVTTNTAIIVGLHASPAVAKTIASASTIAPLDPISFVSGTTSIDTITPPPHISGTGGSITFIATGAWSVSNSGNIASPTFTAVANAAYTFSWDATTVKWYHNI